MATHVISKEPLEPQVVETPNETDWTKPQALAIPKEGYFKAEQGRYGPMFPRTPACHGFTIIAKIKPGTEGEIRQYGKKLENALAGAPHVLAPLQLHYLRWVLFDVGQDKYFMYQGIFDTDFDKYTRTRLRCLLRLGSIRFSRSSKDFPQTGERTFRRSSNSYANTSVRVFWSTASIRTLQPLKSRRL